MIDQFLRSVFFRPQLKKMPSYVVILFALSQTCIPFAARASYIVDSCCGIPVEKGKLIRITMPDPSKVVPSDWEITYQLTHLNDSRRSSWSKKTVQTSDEQINFQFKVEELKGLWEKGKTESDVHADRLFRMSNMTNKADWEDADHFLHQQFMSAEI